jgi:hypothetical protein
MNCSSALVIDVANSKRYEYTRYDPRDVIKFISANEKIFVVMAVEERDSIEEKAKIHERCFLIPDYEESSQVIQVTEQVTCPEVYTDLPDFKEIKGKNKGAKLFIEGKFAILSQRGKRLYSSETEYPFDDDHFCECGDMPDYPVEIVLGFDSHILIKFTNGAAYGLMAANKKRSISKKINRPIGLLSAQEFNEFINDKACDEFIDSRVGCMQDKTNKDMYSKQKIESLPSDYGRLIVEKHYQKFSYSMPNKIFPKPVTNLKINVEKKISYFDRKSRPAYYLLLPLAIATDAVTWPLQMIFFIYALGHSC